MENGIFDLTTGREEKTAEVVNTPVQIVANDDDSRFIVDLTTRQTQYCSMVAETMEEKAALYNATNNPNFRVSEMINMTINLKDVYVEAVKCTNKESGEVQTCPRIVLISDENEGYQCVSIGIFSAIKKLFAIYGEPNEWETAIPVVVKQLKSGERSVLTLNVAV